MYKKNITLNFLALSFLIFSGCVIPSQQKKELNEVKTPINNSNVVKPSTVSTIPNVNDNKVDNTQKTEDKPSLEPISIPSIETSSKPSLDNTLKPSVAPTVVPKDLSNTSSQNNSTSLNSTTAFLYIDVNTSTPKNENEGTISLNINSEKPKSE